MNKIKKRIIVFLALIVIGISTVFATKIAILSDTHVTPGNPNSEKLAEAVDEINKSDNQIVVVSGDLTNEGSDVQLNYVKSILDKIQKPSYIIPGNHENNWSESACKTFNDLWGNDRFITEVDSLIIVGINCGPYMKMGDGHIKQEDLIWLNDTLTAKCTAGKRVLSINHYPILPDLDNYKDYIEVLNKFPVIGHICGHYHQFKYYKSCGIDALMCRALDMGKKDYGYTILEISADSVKQFDKQIGKLPQLMNAYKINIQKEEMADTAEVQYDPYPTVVKEIYQDNASIFTRVGLDEENIYFGNSLGYVKALNKETGKEIWKYKTNASQFSRPAVASNFVIVPTADKRLLWLDKKTGKLLKEVLTKGPFVADGVIMDNVLYQGGDKTFQAWNLKDNTLLWEYDSINNYCQAEPVIDGDDVIFGAWDTNLRCLDRKTGKLKWQWNNGKKANMLGPGNCIPVVTKEKVIIVAPDRYMTALDRKTGKEIWRSNKYKVRESLGHSANNKVAYAKTMDGLIIAVSTEGNEFKPLWVVDAGFGYEHAPCGIVEKNGIVYAGSRNGKIIAIDAKKQKTLWDLKVGSSEVNGWEVDKKGNLYISLIEGAIWSITPKK